MANQVTKDQHYAPKFYFKRFAENNFVQAFHLKLGKLVKPQPYAGICYAKFYYAVKTGSQDDVSQAFEEFFTSIENNFAKYYDSIIENILNYQQLTNEQLDALAWFVACLWIRSPRMRSQMNNMMEDGMKQTMKIIASHPNFIEQSIKELKEDEHAVTQEQIEKVMETFVSGDYQIDFETNENHLNFISQCQDFRDWFYAKSWRFYISKSAAKFITSDTPVIEIFNSGNPMEKTYGNHIMQRKQFFTLNPDILIELVDPLRYRKKVKRMVVSDAHIEQYNLLFARYSQDYCYGLQREDLEALLTYYQG